MLTFTFLAGDVILLGLFVGQQDLDAAELGGLLSWTLPSELTHVSEYRTGGDKWSGW